MPQLNSKEDLHLFWQGIKHCISKDMFEDIFTKDDKSVFLR